MRIIVNDIAASNGGAVTILKDFYHYLINNDRENEWIFLLSENHIEERDNIKVVTVPYVKKGWHNRLRFDFIDGKYLINRFKPDIVISFQNTIMAGIKAPQIVYLHQSIPFQNTKSFSFIKKSERKMAVYQYIVGIIIKKSLINSDYIIVQSNWLKNRLIKDLNINEKKITCVFPSTKDVSIFKSSNVFDNKSFFYPADDYIYKNHKCIYDAVSILNKQKISEFEIDLTINRTSTCKNINCMGKIPYEKVMEKYNTSTLIFPSYIETIGMPLVEARAMETIILASDCPFSREVLDGYENAYFFDPFKPEELASLMERVITKEIIKIKPKNASPQKESWESLLKIIKKNR